MERTRKIVTFQNGEIVSEETYQIPAGEYNSMVIQKLEDIDRKSIRALRSGDTSRLAKLEAEAVALRATLLPDG